MSHIIETSIELLKKFPLCNSCLGRQFSRLYPLLSNSELGRIIKILILLEVIHEFKVSKKRGSFLSDMRMLIKNGGLQEALLLYKHYVKKSSIRPEKCILCKGFFGELDKEASRIVEALKEYDFNSFLVGCHVNPRIEQLEDEIKSKYGLRWGENIRFEVDRELASRLSQILNLPLDRKRPDIVAVIDLESREIEITVNSLFIKGRYRKLERVIAQTRTTWRGEPIDSIESMIASIVLNFTGGSDTRFHGAGREDIDARMLGPGRPFVLEILSPRRRNIDLKKLEREINRRYARRIEVLNLQFASKKDVQRIKLMGERAKKTYRALIELEKEISDEEIQMLQEKLSDVKILQRTPLRVLHRRGDKLRQKHLYSSSFRRIGDTLLEAVFVCDAGLYVKELVSGDNERTIPSVSSILGQNAICKELDVINIEYIRGV